MEEKQQHQPQQQQQQPLPLLLQSYEAGCAASRCPTRMPEMKAGKPRSAGPSPKSSGLAASAAAAGDGLFDGSMSLAEQVEELQEKLHHICVNLDGRLHTVEANIRKDVDSRFRNLEAHAFSQICPAPTLPPPEPTVIAVAAAGAAHDEVLTRLEEIEAQIRSYACTQADAIADRLSHEVETARRQRLEEVASACSSYFAEVTDCEVSSHEGSDTSSNAVLCLPAEGGNSWEWPLSRHDKQVRLERLEGLWAERDTRALRRALRRRRQAEAAAEAEALGAALAEAGGGEAALAAVVEWTPQGARLPSAALLAPPPPAPSARAMLEDERSPSCWEWPMSRSDKQFRASLLHRRIFVHDMEGLWRQLQEAGGAGARAPPSAESPPPSPQHQQQLQQQQQQQQQMEEGRPPLWRAGSNISQALSEVSEERPPLWRAGSNLSQALTETSEEFRSAAASSRRPSWAAGVATVGPLLDFHSATSSLCPSLVPSRQGSPSKSGSPSKLRSASLARLTE